MSSYQDKFVFVSGGNLFNIENPVGTTARFNFETQQWENLPGLFLRRRGHSSCMIDQDLYVFCGVTRHYFTSLVERLRGAASANIPAGSSFESIVTEAPICSPRSKTAVSALNQHEIVILGGQNKNNEDLGDVIIFNTQTGISETVIEQGSRPFRTF